MNPYNFETVAYTNRFFKTVAHLPKEDFVDGQPALMVRTLLKQFRSEENDDKARELREAALREAEKYENMIGVADGDESRQKYEMRHAYALDCISQMKL